MNIAISSVIILLLLLPSIFFRTFVIRSDSFENPLDTSIKTELGIVFLFAVIQHLVGYLFLYHTLDFNIEIDQLYFIIKGESKLINVNLLDYSFIPFLFYILTQIAVGIIVAIVLKKIILKYYLDIRYNYFPITNEWDKLLSGRLFEYDRIRKLNSDIKDLYRFRGYIIDSIKSSDEIDDNQKKQDIVSIKNRIKEEILNIKKLKKIPEYNYVEIDVLVNTSDGDMIYKGRVFKYYLSKDNTLDKIILKDAFRRKFEAVKDESISNNEFYEFESKLFVIKYCEIKNLNVRFTFYEEFDDSDGEDSD